MVWFVITLIFSTLLDIVRLGRFSDPEKDLEIMILRHQLDILARKQKKTVKPSQAEKMTLAILTNKLKQVTNRPSIQLKLLSGYFNPQQFSNGIVNWFAASGLRTTKGTLVVPK